VWREKRIDFIFSRGTEPGNASHDLTCGKPGKNCDYLDKAERYSDHRIVWGQVTV
jgi:hypothetical protein